jgi:hypothetical protein
MPVFDNIDDLLSERLLTYTREMKVAAGYGTLMVFLAIFGKWPLLQVTMGMLAVLRAVAVFLIWRHQRRLHALAQLQCDDETTALGRFLESDISFLTRSLLWYAFPLGLGMLLMGLAFWQHTQSFWTSGACVLLGIGVVLGSYHMNAKRVEEMNSIWRQHSK